MDLWGVTVYVSRLLNLPRILVPVSNPVYVFGRLAIMCKTLLFKHKPAKWLMFFSSFVFRMVCSWMSSASLRFLPHKQEANKNSCTRTENTFICRVTFIHAKPFDVRTLRFRGCSGFRLCIVTSTVLACGLVTY